MKGLLLFLVFVAGCQGMPLEKVQILRNHNNLCHLDYLDAKNHYSKKRQEQIEQRYKSVNKLYKSYLEKKSNEK